MFVVTQRVTARVVAALGRLPATTVSDMRFFRCPSRNTPKTVLHLSTWN